MTHHVQPKDFFCVVVESRNTPNSDESLQTYTVWASNREGLLIGLIATIVRADEHCVFCMRFRYSSSA